MATFFTGAKDLISIEKDSKTITVLKKQKFESFAPDILGLGDIETKSTQINGISVLFDLEGFTTFCKQIDPQLAVPEYLSEFLNWIFSQIRSEIKNKEYPEGVTTYAKLPFLSKFMGDGILFLWDTNGMGENAIMNVVVSMHQICENYISNFLPRISKNVVSPPLKLRCGIARGSIYSVGNGNDFVGPCINVSARLQKLNNLPFCFSRRGLNPALNPFLKREFIVKKVDIRGIGSEELVCVSKRHFKNLSEEEKARFIEA